MLKLIVLITLLYVADIFVLASPLSKDQTNKNEHSSPSDGFEIIPFHSKMITKMDPDVLSIENPIVGVAMNARKKKNKRRKNKNGKKQNKKKKNRKTKRKNNKGKNKKKNRKRNQSRKRQLDMKF
uniref:X1.A.H5.2 n=1 Tax=Schmidtea mediterranea TaxID=79327 RepID=V9XMS3_SCHMD|nr:X1.A.H5.2 [Schmidtea mediterranea]